ncbi:MAG TPA: hypothetical protein VNJ01_09280 [Bacteriovoracaceae bacterium]|nr:hypothetical protein [Bacteriovoracaceae bacterium]
MNLKSTLLLLSLLVSGVAGAHVMKLEDFDQFKLGELLGNLPETVRFKTKTSLTGPRVGFMIKSVFPKSDAPFKMTCRSSYFGGAQYPSYTKCEVYIDLNHRDLNSKYDQHKFVFSDSETVQALRSAIPYSSNRKQFNSFERDRGTTYEGKFTNIFHYIFTCLQSQCTLKLSAKR